MASSTSSEWKCKVKTEKRKKEKKMQTSTRHAHQFVLLYSTNRTTKVWYVCGWHCQSVGRMILATFGTLFLPAPPRTGKNRSHNSALSCIVKTHILTSLDEQRLQLPTIHLQARFPSAPHCTATAALVPRDAADAADAGDSLPRRS